MTTQAPPAPDYGKAAEAQAQSSREVTEQQTWANRPTQNTPWGQTTWEVTPTWDPSTGQYLNSWTQNMNLTDQAQSALDSQLNAQMLRSQQAEQLLPRTMSEYGTAMDWSQFTPMGQVVGAPDYSGIPGRMGPTQAGTYSTEELQRGLDTSGMQGVSSADKYRQDANDAIFNQWASRAEPQFTRDTDALRTQLYNAGLKEGDAAYDREMEKLRQTQGDARQQAQYQATIGSGQEAQRMMGMDKGLREMQFGEELQGGNFMNSATAQALQQNMTVGQQNYQNQQDYINRMNQMREAGMSDQDRMNLNQVNASNRQTQARQQQIAEAMQQRGFSLNEINALLSGQQVGMPTMPQFGQASKSETTQYNQAAQNQYGAAMDAFNAQQQQLQGAMGGLSSLMMFSDRRLKKDIRYVKTLNDLPLYTYRYLWDPQNVIRVGHMADEVQILHPEAVETDSLGYKSVNYGVLYG